MPVLLLIMHELAEFNVSSTGNHCYDLIRKCHAIFFDHWLLCSVIVNWMLLTAQFCKGMLGNFGWWGDVTC